jgi:hypothetical protein
MTFANADYSFTNETDAPPITVVTPLTGAVVALDTTVREVYVQPAAGIAALTLVLPRGTGTGRFIVVGFGAAVTALTLQDGGGNALAGLGPAAGVAGTSFELRMIKGVWVRWR